MPASQSIPSAPRDTTARWRTASPIRRAFVLIGALGMAAGAALVFAGAALAGVGSEPGNLSLSPASGALTSTPTWSTTDGCPTGFQASAELAEFDTSGNLISRISPTVVNITAAFSGTLDGNVGALLAVTNGSGQGGITKSNPGTEEWAVGCWSGAGATGTVEYVQSIFVTITCDGSSYATSSSVPTSCPSTSMSPSTSPSASPSSTPSATQSVSPSSSTTPTPTTSTSAAIAPPASSVVPSGAPQTGAGGASGTGPNALLIAIGAALFAASSAAVVLAIRRSRASAGVYRPGEEGPGIL